MIAARTQYNSLVPIYAKYSAHQASLPPGDSDRGNYNCGSDSFDQPFYAWLGLVTVLISVVLFKYSKQYGSLFNMYFNLIDELAYIGRFSKLNLSSSISNSINKVEANTKQIVTISLYLMLYILIIMVTIYSIVGSYYGLYTYQYAWTVSASFQSGTVAFFLSFFALLILMVMLLSLLMSNPIMKENSFGLRDRYSSQISNIVGINGIRTRSIARSLSSNFSFAENIEDLKPKTRCHSLFLRLQDSVFWIIAPILNFLVVGSANYLYVFLYLHYSSSDVLFIFQIILAMFKSVWNSYCYAVINRRVNYFFNVDDLSVSHWYLQLFIRLTNSITIPCLVVATINTECFYTLFVTPPPVIAYISYQICVHISMESNCDVTSIRTDETLYNPPFYYSYQCSSQFITSYAPIFVYLCIIESFIIPLVQFLMVKTLDYAIRTNNKTLLTMKFTVTKLLRLSIIDEMSDEDIKLDYMHPYFDSLQVYLNSFTYLGLIMTFGAVFPPLAFSFFITMYIMKYKLIFKLNRFLLYAVEKKKIKFVEIINEECEAFLDRKMHVGSVWMLVTFSSCFYSLFLFDTLGSEVGVYEAYWV